MRVLIVEDEPKSAAYLRKGLSEHGYVADLASNGEDGLYLARHSDYDLLILDVMLPRRDGWSVIAELRRAGKQTPALFLTARDAVPDRVKGLELGRMTISSNHSLFRSCWRVCARFFVVAPPVELKTCALPILNSIP